jgi:hypothetical protein
VRYKLNGDEIAAETIAGEAVILNLSSGVYYSLDGAGGLVWSLLERGHSPAEAATRVAERFGVEEGDALADIESLLSEVLAEGLLVEDGASEPRELLDDELPPAGDYAKPGLQAYTDMGDMLALDPPMPGLKDVPWRAPGA